MGSRSPRGISERRQVFEKASGDALETRSVQPQTGKERDRASVLGGIDSVVVLCGSVHTSPLARRVERSLVDLPLGSGLTVAGHHYEGVRAFASRNGTEQLRMRLFYDNDGIVPRGIVDADDDLCSIEQDPAPIRGVAGLLSDSTKDIDDDQYIVVLNGALVFLEPLWQLIESMAQTQADISFVASPGGAPVGLWLIRCGVLRSINPVGYIDLKEQALEQWKDTYSVRVVQRPRAYALPTRSLPEYIEALHSIALGPVQGASIDTDPYREEWESCFAIQEAGSTVDPDAILHDSVALAGSKVGHGAVVVRSVLCEGAVVQPGAMVADQVVTGVVRKGRGR